MLSQTIDELAFERREDNTIVAQPGEQLDWLCMQLVRYPTRVDETKTTNISFLMCSAARTIAHQAEEIERLKKQLQQPA